MALCLTFSPIGPDAPGDPSFPAGPWTDKEGDMNAPLSVDPFQHHVQR